VKMTINSILNGRVATALVMLLIFLSMSLLALGFTEKARLMPLLIGIPGTVLGIIELFNEMRASVKAAASGDTSNDVSEAERAMFGWVIAFFFGILCFGFIYAGPLLVFSFMLAGKKESLKVGLISAAGTFVVVYGFFQNVMEIPLFEGLVIEWLLG
jgi:hypothetical protein